MGLAELDELVLKCRGEQAKRYIREAVACYNAGAYRSCIISVWIALVFDLIDKYRELDMTGDKEARAVVEQFTQLQQTGDIAGGLEFERSILEIARDRFQLLTPLEYVDLKRLQEDRNRCAHPSMQTSEEVYDPPAELARCHLRNAVTCVIQHPPLQGKAALDRLVQEVHSDYFPVDVVQAISYFKSGPLARPRESLTRNFVIVLVKNILLEPPDTKEGFRRLLTALQAVRAMYTQVANLVFEQFLNDLVRRIPDKGMLTAVGFLSVIEDTWQHLRDDMKAKVKTYVSVMPDDELYVLPWALELSPLRSTALERLGNVHIGQLEDLAQSTHYRPIPAFIQRAVDLLAESENFASANAAARVLTRWVSHLTDKQIETVAEAVCTNGQVSGAFDVLPLVAKIYSASDQIREKIRSILGDYGCLEQWEKAIASQAGPTEDEIPF